MKKRVLSSILCLTMLLVTVINPMVSYAADADNYLSVAQYRNQGGKNIAPNAPEGKVFAGWYKDAEFTKPWGESITAEKAYAKFVNKEVLSVKWQILDATESDSKITDARFITTVDSEYYKEVGFVLTVNGRATAPQMSDTVYERIAGWVDGNQNYYEPTVFDATSKYFMVWELLEVPNEAFATDITVDAVWTTLDGTTVSGKSTDANVAEVLVEADMDAGVTFEYPKHANVTTGATRVKYADTSIGAQAEAYGEYGMQKKATGSAYPHVTVNYNKTYPVGSVFTCKLYVEVDTQVVTDLGANAYFWMGSWQANPNPDVKITKFNEWVDVSFILQEASVSSLDFFCNFAVGGGDESTKFGSNAVTVYVDNIQVTGWSFDKGVTFENGVDQKAFTGSSIGLVKYADTSIGAQAEVYGSYGMRFEGTGQYWPHIYATYEKSYPMGSIFHCKIYVEVDEAVLASVTDPCFYVSSWDADDGLTGKITTFNNWVDAGLRINKENGLSQLDFFPNFEELIKKLPDGTKITVYVDNFYISDGNFEEGISLDNEAAKYWFNKRNIGEIDGKKAITWDATNTYYAWFGVYFNQAYTSPNTVLGFRVYVEADPSKVENQPYYVDGYSSREHSFNKWEEDFVVVSSGSSEMNTFVNLEKAITAVGADVQFTIYLTDFYITQGDLTQKITFNTNVAEQGLIRRQWCGPDGYYHWGNQVNGYSFVEKFGSTVLQMDGTGQQTHAFYLYWNQAYDPQKYIYFNIYVEADEEVVEGKTFTIGGAGSYPYNKWINAAFSTGTGMDRELFWSFGEILKDAAGNNAKVTVYLDDFEIR